MVQRRRGARFDLEAREPVGVGCRGRRQHLDRHVAVQPRVAAL
jgi:hypothetical protein